MLLSRNCNQNIYAHPWWNYLRNFEEALSFRKCCTSGRLFQVQRKIQLKEFPRKCCALGGGKPDFFKALANSSFHSLQFFSKFHLISTDKRGIHSPPVTKRLTQNHFYMWANVLPKFFLLWICVRTCHESRVCHPDKQEIWYSKFICSAFKLRAVKLNDYSAVILWEI